jgi:hypothetical protein
LYFAGGSEEKTPPANYAVEADGDAENINFVEKSNAVHEIVNSCLQKSKAAVLDEQTEEKSVGRKQKAGLFIWSVKTTDIRLIDGDIEDFAAALDESLSAAGAKILNRVKDKRDYGKAIRFDIGINDSVDEDAVTIITDKLFLPDNDSGDLPKEGRLAFVIDDFGYSKEAVEAFRTVDLPLTFAVLPNLAYSRDAAEKGHADGRRIILHLPMEAESSGASVEKMVLNVAMSDDELKRHLYDMLASVPYAIGVNNHQGSKATADPRTVRVVLNALLERGYFFIDSRTSGRSIAYDTAIELGVLSGENRLFIDNKNDVNDIKLKIREAAEIARRDKAAIVIGHARHNTAEALRQMKDELKAMGVAVVFATEVLD